MTCQELTHTLVESFNALADEVQNLIDRKTILEHKLRYAHEQYQYLADKYAPAVPAVSETLAKLQLPPEVRHPALEHTHLVPLPRRGASSDNAQLALFIREGRKVASKLSSLTDRSKTSTFTCSKDGLTATDMTTLPITVLEQDFTIQGKKGQLKCPFSTPTAAVTEDKVAEENPVDMHENAGAKRRDSTPHHGADPICAAMLDETASQGAASGTAAATKCPIRFLDQHSAEEIAHYVETHKHEIPRSHEVCIQRYQRNEDQIRKLDAKYGSLVGMIADLSQLHKPMLPRPETQEDVDRASNRRVEDWAHNVSANQPDDPPEQGVASPASAADGFHDHDGQDVPDEDAREGHFDRLLKEVRVGESPSRPWGISVPVYDSATLHSGNADRPVSPPPAPVHMPRASEPQTPRPTAEGKAGPSKCPFDHSKLQGVMSSPFNKVDGMDGESPRQSVSAVGFTPLRNLPQAPSSVPPKPEPPESSAPGYSGPRPAFISPPSVSKPGQPAAVPQMLFTGPVFIGYPIEQAIQFMQHFQNNR